VLRAGSLATAALSESLPQAEPLRVLDHLQAIRYDGRWEDWFEFFLEGVVEVAEGATGTTRRIVEMIDRIEPNFKRSAVPLRRRSACMSTRSGTSS
jgi:hypothetical protein